MDVQRGQAEIVSLNCEDGSICERGRRSEIKELPHLIPNAVHHGLQAWQAGASIIKLQVCLSSFALSDIFRRLEKDKIVGKDCNLNWQISKKSQSIKIKYPIHVPHCTLTGSEPISQGYEAKWTVQTEICLYLGLLQRWQKNSLFTDTSQQQGSAVDGCCLITWKMSAEETGGRSAYQRCCSRNLWRSHIKQGYSRWGEVAPHIFLFGFKNCLLIKNFNRKTQNNVGFSEIWMPSEFSLPL